MLKFLLNPVCMALVAGTVTLGTMGVVSAADVHLKGGANSEPLFTDGGLTLNAAGELAGLGNGDVKIDMTARANVDARCVNPGSGGQEPPGQNPAPITVTGTQVVPATEIKNGNLPFSVTTVPPQTPIPGAPDCPNPNWSEVIRDLAFTSATILVFQPASPPLLVLRVDCTLSPPTTNGAVPGSRVTCTSTSF